MKVKSSQIKSSNFWRKISKAAIYILVFLLPLFFLPFTTNVLDFNKQILLISLTLISLFGWLLGSLSEGKISVNLNLFNIPVIVFFVVLGISTGFSAYKYGSFWGWPLNISASFLTVFGFVLLYFLIVNIFRKKQEIFWLLIILIFSSFLTAVFGGLQIFGRFLFPFDFSKITSFNTIGTIRSLGIFMGVLLPLVIFLISITKKLIKLLLVVFGLAAFCLLFIINFWVAWLSVLVGTALILILGIARRGTFGTIWLNLVMGLFIIALVFSFLRIPITFLPAIPVEVSLSQRVSFSIASQSLKGFNPPVSLLFGSGLGTFTYDYSRFKPETINQTAFWSVRFASGASEILDKLTTTGILGVVSFLGILGTFAYLGVKQLMKKGVAKKDFHWLLTLGVFASWVSLVATTFLYSSNLSLLFLFWILTAIFVALQEERDRVWTLEPSSLAAIGVSFVFVLTFVLGIGLLFLTTQRYIAEVKYFQGLNSFQRGDSQSSINYLLSAVNLTNRSQDNYLRDLSQIYLFRVNQELQRISVPQEELLQRITPLVADAVNSTKTATDVAPKNVANWTIRGFIYAQLRNIIPGVDEWAIKCYQEALKLEPTNPFIWTELGRVYLAKNDLVLASEQFQKAIELKPDYAPAHFQTAILYQMEGRIAEAIEKLEMTKQIVPPLDVGVAFQLGILYYNDNQLDKAKAELERAVTFSPTYSNARYFLGLIYDKEGEKDKAIEQFEMIAIFNPDNEEVQKILANLKTGEDALLGIVPGEPPIEEKPPERIEE